MSKKRSIMERYYDWKLTQPRDQTPMEVEHEALEWGYRTGLADMEKHVRERLFNFKA